MDSVSLFVLDGKHDGFRGSGLAPPSFYLRTADRSITCSLRGELGGGTYTLCLISCLYSEVGT